MKTSYPITRGMPEMKTLEDIRAIVWVSTWQGETFRSFKSSNMEMLGGQYPVVTPSIQESDDSVPALL